MNRSKNISFLSLFFLFLFVSSAQTQQKQEEVSFSVELSKERLGINERLRVDFVMNQDGDNFVPPDFEGFRVVMGPSQFISSNWVNGVRSFSKTYSYTLAPSRQGKIKIDQAIIEIGGETYKTPAREVTITEAVERPGMGSSTEQIADENLHLVAEISKTKPYLNEPISIVYKLYVSPTINVSHFNPLDNPKYNNFWSQEIPFSRYNVQEGTYKGKPYRYVVLKRVVLYPQKSGQLEIEPLSLDVTLEVPTNKRDFFGSRIYHETNKVVTAGKRTIQVKALPEEGKPENFSGAVGKFEFEVRTSKTELNASESLQAQVEVKGMGNLKLFQLPELNLPSSLEVYEPELDQDVRTTINGMQGKMVNSYTVVPSYQGKYPIPTINFNYFDPKEEAYVELNSEEITINVLTGAVASNPSANIPTVAGRAPVVGTDAFHFIKLNPELRPRQWTSFFGTAKFYSWLLGPIFLIPLFIFLIRRKEERDKDEFGNRIKKANRLARRYLSEAKKFMDSKDKFYVALERALHNYLKAKLHIETAEFSKEKITGLLKDRNIDEDTISGFISLLKNCEMARYSPFSQVQIKQDYEKASEIITQLDRNL